MNHLLRMTLMDAPFSSGIEYAADFFLEHPHLRVKAVASTTTPVETRYEIIHDETDQSRSHDAVALSWKPRWPLFPTFEGSVTIRPHFTGSMLSLEGVYQPPGGFLGQTFDRIIGQRLAYATMDHLLSRLRHYVERRYREYQATCPSIEELNASTRAASQQSV
ncbi:MAG: hypothetical protein M3N19_08665 [Candidatus Eremiobacteraeota bacterium]|nr:hypothetical protein [Candidatus Eremiobacteraeota bacterium]